MKAVAAGCASLKELDVRSCSNLTDESIEAVARGCPSLTSLYVDGCSEITNESF
jgi:EIN3-binding F-box protein